MANIRRARRSGLVVRGGRSVRESLWIGVGATATIITGPQGNAILNSFNTIALALRPFTNVRVRGVMHMESDQTAAAENQAAAIAYAVVSDQASAVGITAVPTPVADLGSDLFFVYKSLLGSSLVGETGDGANVMAEYDSRAMRRVDDDSDLVVVLGTDVAALSAGVFVRHSARLLVKLH